MGLKTTNKKLWKSTRLTRIKKIPTMLFGPEYKPNHHRIEIDITFKCNLNCFNCNRSCRQAPSDEAMSVDQIKKFIGESISQIRKWECITIMGGEPTLHPGIFEIIKILLLYCKEHSPETSIRIASNGFARRLKRF
jgi:molybdenum cofactor biosynthesis enzyme MoaA